MEESSIGGKSEIHIVQLALHQTPPTDLAAFTHRNITAPFQAKPQEIAEPVNKTKDGQTYTEVTVEHKHTQHTPTIIPNDNIRLHSSPNVTARSDILAAAMLQAAVL